MKSPNEKFAPLGEVVAAIFDKAAAFEETPAETARLASLAVMRLWLRSRGARPGPSRPPSLALAGLLQ